MVLRHKRLGRTNRSGRDAIALPARGAAARARRGPEGAIARGRDGGTQANSLRYNNWLKQHRLDSRLVHQMLAQMSIA